MKPKAASVFITTKAGGFSVIEVLLSLILTTVLATVLLSTLSHLIRNTDKLEQHLKSDEAFIHLTQAVFLWIKSTDFSPYAHSHSLIDIKSNQLDISGYKTWIARGVTIKNTNEVLLDSTTTIDAGMLTLFMPTKTITLQVKSHYGPHVHFNEKFKQSQIVYLSDVHRIRVIYDSLKRAVYFQYDGLKPVIMLPNVSRFEFKKVGLMLSIKAMIGDSSYQSECMLP